MNDTTKPPAINRLDPAWAMFAAAITSGVIVGRSVQSPSEWKLVIDA